MSAADRAATRLDPDELAALLEPHAHRPIRAFLRAPDPGNHADSDVHEAFWAVLYGSRNVDHSTAVAVARELVQCPRPVRDVVNGWKPAALAESD